MTDERLRPYARHLDGCRFVLDLMDAPDPTLAAKGQCDCGLDEALAATPEIPIHVHDYGTTRIPCSQDHSGVGDSTLPEHPFYQDPLPREAGRCDAVYPDGEWCGLSEQEHRAALAATPETPTLDAERSGDTFPKGWGCPCCDGTGFVSDEMADKLRALDAFPPDERALDARHRPAARTPSQVYDDAERHPATPEDIR